MLTSGSIRSVAARFKHSLMGWVLIIFNKLTLITLGNLFIYFEDVKCSTSAFLTERMKIKHVVIDFLFYITA